ncbi:MAG: hypothetical protein QJT81_14800 [Candidatus Thiothrix putei]|uniref:Uncharacterized protein n=1 Tax=Candidatus Thiothrix putei TaxID=3080811 RepID=A0AA95H9H4_9GAMM|nr:MAG: hypothetical protein QJT81_14800 [Candidatus Thiothrix putei]
MNATTHINIEVDKQTDDELQLAKRQKQIWRDSGFIGGFSGPEDLSARYKQYHSERSPHPQPLPPQGVKGLRS